MTLFFRNCKVLPMTAAAGEPNCFDGYVGVEGRRIALVTADAAAAEAWRAVHVGAREIDGRGGILMPGLVNTHCHMAMTLQRSYADDMALMEWLNDHIWPFEARQTDDDIRVGALLGAAEMLLGGVTSVVDMYWSEAAVFDAVDRAGMRALLCASSIRGSKPSKATCPRSSRNARDRRASVRDWRLMPPTPVRRRICDAGWRPAVVTASR